MITRQITQRLSTSILWLLIAAYAAVTVIPDAFPRMFASPFNVPAAVLLSLCFGLIHGAIRYGIGGIAVFLALCLGISNVMENIGVLTGFPFGHYHYTDVRGTKLLLVPLGTRRRLFRRAARQFSGLVPDRIHVPATLRIVSCAARTPQDRFAAT